MSVPDAGLKCTDLCNEDELCGNIADSDEHNNVESGDEDDDINDDNDDDNDNDKDERESFCYVAFRKFVCVYDIIRRCCRNYILLHGNHILFHVHQHLPHFFTGVAFQLSKLTLFSFMINQIAFRYTTAFV